METLSHCVRLYVPDEPAGMLASILDWLKENGITGFTQWAGQGAWHDGQAWVHEPVQVVECWVNTVPDMVEYLALLALYGQQAGFYVLDGQAYLEDLIQ